MKIIITVDTEADRAWTAPTDDLSIDNLRFVPRFQALCERYGMKPTYLCTYEVVTSKVFEETILSYQRRGAAEIGAHLHPWTNPPFLGGPDIANVDRSEYPAYPSELPVSSLRAKLEVLTKAINAHGVTPTSYRAGRWGFSKEHIPILLQLGYTVDCSVTPHVDRSTYKGVSRFGPDFRSATSAAPYELSSNDVCAEGDSGLYEVPVTILHTSALMRRSESFRRLFRRFRRTLPVRIINRALNLEPTWFRPYPYLTARHMQKVYETAVALRLPAMEMMLHSSELMPGGSRSFRTDDAIEKMYKMLESTLRALHRSGCEGATLSAFSDQQRPRTNSARARVVESSVAAVK